MSPRSPPISSDAAPSSQSLDAALDELDGRRAQAIEVVGAAGIGKTRLLAELAARADAPRTHRARRRGRRPRTRSAVLGVRRRARRVPRERRAAPAGEPRRGRTGRARAGLPVARRARPRRSPGLQTSATGPTARCASCSNGWPPPSRWCSSSTTSTGPTPPRSTSLPACCTGPPAAGVLIALGGAAHQRPPRLPAPSIARSATAADPHRA